MGFVLLIYLVFSVVFVFFCLRPVSCVPNLASFSGMSILDCTFRFLYHLFNEGSYGRVAELLRSLTYDHKSTTIDVDSRPLNLPEVLMYRDNYS